MDQRARVGSAVVGQSVVAYIIQVEGSANVQGLTSLETIPVRFRQSSASVIVFCVVSADAVRLFAVSVGRARAAPTKTAAACAVPPTSAHLDPTPTNASVEVHPYSVQTEKTSSIVFIHNSPTHAKVVTSNA